MNELKIVSYNIHKGFSLLGRRYTLDSIKVQLESLNADLVFLQEVRGLCPKGEYANQLEHLADSLWPHTAYGKNAIFNAAHHGNAILSRYPLDNQENRDVSRNRFERRGILYSSLHLPNFENPMHLFCLHLNLLEKDRFRQAEDLREFVGEKSEKHEPVIVAGDFNDWTGRLTNHLGDFMDHSSDKVGEPLTTYPSFYPVFQLDRIFTKNVDLIHLERLRSKKWERLSDHLPLMARVAIRQ